MTILVFLMHLILAVFLIDRFRLLQIRGMSSAFSMALFAGKCLIVWLLFGYISENPQPADSGFYIKDSRLIFNLIREEPAHALKYIFGTGELPPGFSHSGFEVWNAITYLPFFNDNKTIILLNVLICFFAFGSSGVHLIWMTMIGWIGLCRLSDAVFPGRKVPCLNLLPFIVPGVMLWNTLVLKEPLLIFCLGFLVYGLVQWSRHEKNSWKIILTAIVGFLFIKTFLLVLLIPSTLAFLISHFYKKAFPVIVFSLVFSMIVLTLIILSYWSDVFDIPALLYGQQLSMYRFVVYSHAGSILKPVMLAPEWASFIKRIPESIGYALLQPFPWKYDVKLDWLVFAENLFVVIFILYGFLRNYHVIAFSPKRLMLITAGLTILLVAGFVAPVAGTLIRYRMPGVLLLMLGVLPSRHVKHSQEHHTTAAHEN